MNEFHNVSVQRERIEVEVLRRKGRAEAWLIRQLARSWARQARMETHLASLHETVASLHEELRTRSTIIRKREAES